MDRLAVLLLSWSTKKKMGGRTTTPPHSRVNKQIVTFHHSCGTLTRPNRFAFIRHQNHGITDLGRQQEAFAQIHFPFGRRKHTKHTRSISHHHHDAISFAPTQLAANRKIGTAAATTSTVSIDRRQSRGIIIIDGNHLAGDGTQTMDRTRDYGPGRTGYFRYVA
jgi:hypothetical protein